MHDIFFLDWLNTAGATHYNLLSANRPYVQRVPIGEDLTATVKRCADRSSTEKFWIVSSLNDHTNLNFDWTPDEYTEKYMQVFGHNTWLIDKSYISRLRSNPDIHDFPDKHCVIDPTAGTIKTLDEPLDIIYIDNGEPDADTNFAQLEKCTKHVPNRLLRVTGVKGRRQAYQTAANRSKTAWFFAVFAKLKVNTTFHWSWHPDVMHGAKHYTFTATNPVNGLEYGHMAIVAYNKFLTLDTSRPGLDFVMSKPNMTVEANSGVAVFNQNPLMTWRTAFREVLKLKRMDDAVSQHRLNTWLTVGNGKFGEWSCRGAQDAVQFYNDVNGRAALLQQSFEWDWLERRFNSLYMK